MSLNDLFESVRRETGLGLSGYRRELAEERIADRRAALRVGRSAGYLDRLRGDPENG